ncbi:MAG: hypothetical protein Q4P25_04200 [Tissierellia bacterium]|nr:hypothetical protein [Tissierellia bacterium]
MKQPVEVTLVYKKEIGKDKWGNPLIETDYKKIIALRKSASQTEFYQGAAQGYKPEVVFELYTVELDDAKNIIYKDVVYTIIRTYTSTLDKTEVICERKMADEY